MPLWETIRELRIRTKLTQAEFAKRLGISQTHASKMERPPDAKYQRIPPVKTLRKMATIFAKEEQERQEIEFRLLVEREEMVAPKEVAELINNSLKSRKAMPMSFLMVLKDDLDGCSDILETLENASRADIESALEGKKMLSRKAVIELAMKLEKSVDDYLMLSGYVPEHLKVLLGHRKVMGMLRKMEELSPDEVDELLDAILKVVEIYIKKR